MESTILDKYKNYLIYRQRGETPSSKRKKIAFCVQKTGDFASDPTL